MRIRKPKIVYVKLCESYKNITRFKLNYETLTY